MYTRSSVFPSDAINSAWSKNTQHLEKIFHSLKENSNREVQMSITVCKEIFINELNVKFDNVNFLMKYALLECLCYYMQIWKGWKDANMDFDEFKAHLKVKTGFIIDHHEKFYGPAKNIDEIGEDLYSLEIYANPMHVNNMVFWLKEDNSLLTKHPDLYWIPLNIQEFINFPNVSVLVDLPFLKFDRSSLHEYKTEQEYKKWHLERDIKFSHPNDEFNDISYEDLIEDYTLGSIIIYLNQLTQIIKTFNKEYNLKNKINVVSEIETILEEFAQDLEEFNTEKPSTMIPYEGDINIGGHVYTRDSMKPDSDNFKSERVNLFNIIIPKVEFTLSKFRIQRDYSTPCFSFMDLNAIPKSSDKQKQCFVNQINSCISYSCRTCSKVFSGENGFGNITKHFRKKHKCELPILCYKCKEKFEVHDLLGTRWSHKCIVVQ